MPFFLTLNRTYIRGDGVNKTERDIKKFYHSINIKKSFFLNMELIANRVGIGFYHWPNTSMIIEYDCKYYIAINDTINTQQQWQQFGHEMCHYLYDDCNFDLSNESFVDYCEAKAEYFAYHFCVPTFMLKKIKGVDVYDVMDQFNVEYDFALRRLEMYKHKYINRRDCHGVISQSTC